MAEKDGFMKVEEALEIVLELARGNALDPNSPWTLEEQDLREVAERQQAALASLEDFHTNVLQEERHTPKVLIYMEGGLIHDVSVSEEMEVLILDYDTEGGDEDRIKPIKPFPGDPAQQYEDLYIIDKGLVQATPEWVDYYFKEARGEDG